MQTWIENPKYLQKFLRRLVPSYWCYSRVTNIVEIDYSLCSIYNLAVAGKYEFIHEGLTSLRANPPTREKRKVEFSEFTFEEDIPSEFVLFCMKTKNIRPATFQETLMYANRLYLGNSFKDWFLVALSLQGEIPNLWAGIVDGRDSGAAKVTPLNNILWDKECRFLGVKE